MVRKKAKNKLRNQRENSKETYLQNLFVCEILPIIVSLRDQPFPQCTSENWTTTIIAWQNNILDKTEHKKELLEQENTSTDNIWSGCILELTILAACRERQGVHSFYPSCNQPCSLVHILWKSQCSSTLNLEIIYITILRDILHLWTRDNEHTHATRFKKPFKDFFFLLIHNPLQGLPKWKDPWHLDLTWRLRALNWGSTGNRGLWWYFSSKYYPNSKEIGTH